MKSKGWKDCFKFLQKKSLFFISYNNQVLLEVISRFGSPSCTLPKRPSSPLQSGQEENIPGHLFKRRTYWFALKTVKLFSILTNRVERDSLEDKSTLAPSKKGLPSPFSLTRRSIYQGTHLKEEITDLFWKLPGYSIFPEAEQKEEGQHFAND